MSLSPTASFHVACNTTALLETPMTMGCSRLTFLHDTRHWEPSFNGPTQSFLAQLPHLLARIAYSPTVYAEFDPFTVRSDPTSDSGRRNPRLAAISPSASPQRLHLLHARAVAESVCSPSPTPWTERYTLWRLRPVDLLFCILASV